jgi:hypothetical protein
MESKIAPKEDQMKTIFLLDDQAQACAMASLRGNFTPASGRVHLDASSQEVSGGRQSW